MTDQIRRCRVCEQGLNLAAFPPDRPDGSWHWRCRSCQADAYRSRYHRDDSRRTLQIAYSFNGSAIRCFPGALPIEPAALVALLRETPNCRYCLLPNTQAGLGFHLDHVTPLSKGGAHMLENLLLCCDRCNRAKWDSFEEEYETWLQGVAKRLRPLE